MLSTDLQRIPKSTSSGKQQKTAMFRLILFLVCLCMLGERRIVSGKQLKLGTSTRKTKSDNFRKDYRFTNQTYSTFGQARWKELQESLKLSKDAVKHADAICDIICNEIECIEYVCEGGVCCTIGSPESLCCPIDYPICIDSGRGGCCAAGHPKSCGLYCCEEDTMCCATGCCEVPDMCCGAGCCEAGDVCCTDHCCDTNELCCGAGCCDVNVTCCGGDCCSENQTCCTVGGEEKCCNKTSEEACSSQLNNSPCPFQFDALECAGYYPIDKYQPLEMPDKMCPDISESMVMYRLLRPDESCYEGLKAKDPSASESVLSFVNCGSRQGYASQYISATSSLAVARKYQKIAPDSKIAQIEVNKDLLAICEIVDLVSVDQRKKYLGYAKSIQFVNGACEFLLTCKARIACEEI